MLFVCKYLSYLVTCFTYKNVSSCFSDANDEHAQLYRECTGARQNTVNAERKARCNSHQIQKSIILHCRGLITFTNYYI